MGWLVKVGIVLGIALAVPSRGQQNGLGCVDAMEFTAWAAQTKYFGGTKVVDRKGRPVDGQVEVRSGYLWLFTQWDEPIALGSLVPPALVEGVKFHRGRFELKQFQIAD